MCGVWCPRLRLHEQHPQDDPDVLPRLRPDRQALCSRFLQKLHRISGEELINSHQCEFMLLRLRNQQTIKWITVNRWKLSQMSHCPLVN